MNTPLISISTEYVLSLLFIRMYIASAIFSNITAIHNIIFRVFMLSPSICSISQTPIATTMIPAASIYSLTTSIRFPMLFSMLYRFIKTHYSYFMHNSWVFPRGFTSLYAYYSLLCIFYARFMHNFGANIALCTLYICISPVICDTLWGSSCTSMDIRGI